MNISKEEFEELLEIRNKADILPKVNWRYERLQYFLECVLGLQSFSQDEKDKLTTEFSNLSPEDAQVIINNVIQKNRAADFYLSPEEVAKVNKGRKDLSFHERARLSNAFRQVHSGFAWLDLGKIFSAEIEIDDHSSPERETKPYTHIYFSDGYNRRVETIDVLESVRQNPLAIGHPAIVAAIYYWQKVIFFKNLYNLQDKDDDNVYIKSYRDIFPRHRVKIAEENLKAVCDAIYAGANERSLSERAGLVVSAETLDLDNKKSLLYCAWKYLKHWKPGDFDLIKFEKDLRNESPNFHNPNLRLTTVMNFLRDESKRDGGYRFIGAKTPSWKTFRNAFKAWYYGKSVQSVKNYPIQTKTELSPDKDMTSEAAALNLKVSRLMIATLANPLVFVREPVWLNESDMDINIEASITAKCTVKT